jgi:hypothetical protein
MSDTIGGITTVTQQQQIEAPQSQLLLPKQFVGTLKANSNNPSVKNVTRWVAANTDPINIIDFRDGQDGQEIKILGDGVTTVNDNVKIKTNTGANKLLAPLKVYTFTKFFDVWIEDV